jgi:thymidylate synthase
MKYNIIILPTELTSDYFTLMMSLLYFDNTENINGIIIDNYYLHNDCYYIGDFLNVSKENICNCMFYNPKLYFKNTNANNIFFIIFNNYTDNIDTIKKNYDIDTIYIHFDLLQKINIINYSISIKTNDGTIILKKNRNITEETQYLEIMSDILNYGFLKNARNGNTLSLFNGHQMKFNLNDNVMPVITTKKIFLRGVFEELMFFLRGETNTNVLKKKGVNIWNANTSRDFLDNIGLTNYKEGDIGTSYSFQFRHYGAEYKGYDNDYENKGIDQFNKLIKDIIENKDSRRLIMTTYNPSQLSQGVLPPCHGLVIQFNVCTINNVNKLNCHMYQRSGDWFLGVPWNISSYAFLLIIVCNIVNNQSNLNLEPNDLIMTFGDVHLYEQHIDFAKEQINRNIFKFPSIKINKKLEKIEDLEWNDIEIINYECYDNNFNAKMIA